MKRNRSTLFCMILCAGMCAVFIAGCGGEYAGLTEGDAVSGSAVSGEAVSGDAIQENTVSGPALKDKKDAESRNGKTDMSSHRFCTDTNLYYVENDSKIMQARVDGTHRKCIKEWEDKGEEENYAETIYADKNWLYYEVCFDCEEDIIYRAPIEKDAEGQDVVRFQKAEELVKTLGYTNFIRVIYGDSDYCFYREIHTDTFIKYDLKRKKKVSEIKIEEATEIFRVNDYYLAVGGDSSYIYVQKVNSIEWEKISVSEGEFDHSKYYGNAQNDRAVFVARYNSEKGDAWHYGVDILRCDEKAATDFVTWEQMVRTVTEAAGVEELDICGVEGYFYFWQEGRLYIQMQVGWVKDGLYHMEYMMISQGENEDGSGSGLRYEKGLTECMNSHVKERKGKWSDYLDEDEEEIVFVENMVVNDAECIAMVEGKAYLSLYDYEKEKGRLGCYDLDTGKFEWIGENTAAFYKLACDLNPDKFAWVFERNNPHEDTGSFWPSKDEEGHGYFVEDKK